MTPARDDAPGWWEDRRFILALIAFMALPLVWPEVPPLVDLYGHLGRYKVQLDGAVSPTLSAFYGFEWRLIGNLGVDLLIIPLAPIFGLELAVKLIVLAIPPLTAAGMLWISKEVHGRISPATLLALPVAYSHPFMFGFVNFALSMAFALNAFALWHWLGRTGRTGLRAILYVPIGLIIWVTHSFGWGVLGLMCFAWEVVHARDEGANWARAAIRAGIQVLPLVPPALLMLAWRTGGVEGDTGDWFHWAAKLTWATMTLRDRWLVIDVFSINALVLALFFIGKRDDFMFSRNLRISALVLAATFILMPRIVFGSAYADMRLLPFVLVVALIALRPNPGVSREVMSRLAMIGLAFIVLRIGAHTVSFFLYDQLHRATRVALDHIPQGARVAAFVGREPGLPWYTDREDHIPAFVIVRRDGFSNDQWAMAGAQLLTIRKNDARQYQHDPSQLVKAEGETFEEWKTIGPALRDLPRDAFDYIWLISPPPFDAKLLAGTERVWSNGHSSVYRIVRPATAATVRTGR